ncbi:MAG: prepilin peptidase [Bdellovibrionales bacterium]
MTPEIAHNLILILAALMMIYAAGSDAARFRIPNSVSLGLLALFPLYALVAPVPVLWLEHLKIFAVVLIVGYILFLRNLAGAGDIKLISVIALWAGPSAYAPFLLITALAGGVLSIGIGLATLIHQHLSPKKKSIPLSQTPIPYGVAIAVGGLCTLTLLSHPDLLQGQL